MTFAPLVLCAAQAVGRDKSLDVFLGSWHSEETATLGNGQTIHFTCDGTNKRILDGRFLVIDELVTIPKGPPDHNHILMSWDPEATEYRACFFTSQSPKPIELAGPMDGSKLILTSEAPALRITFDFDRDGHYLADVQVKRGTDWTTLTKAEYTRVLR